MYTNQGASTSHEDTANIRNSSDWAFSLPTGATNPDDRRCGQWK